MSTRNAGYDCCDLVYESLAAAVLHSANCIELCLDFAALHRLATYNPGARRVKVQTFQRLQCLCIVSMRRLPQCSQSTALYQSRLQLGALSDVYEPGD